MDTNTDALPLQLVRRAATATFMVELEAYFTAVLDGKLTRGIADTPIPPDHLERAAVEDCRTISAMVALARQSVYQVTWDADDYANDVSNTALPNPEVEARLMAKYPPLIPIEEVTRRHDDNLPIILGPAIVTDVKGRILLWSLPNVLSDSRQTKLLRATRLLEGQMTVDEPEPGTKPTKGWRTSATFYEKNGQWISGSTLLYPAGYQQGHKSAKVNPTPSAALKSTRAADWMAAFEENGGILDGVLAITHPELYDSAQAVMKTIWREHATVIINRSTLGHRDCHGAPGWYDLLVTLGNYGKTAVLELRGLGISIPYDAGSIVPLSSKLLVHGVPKVRGERICYAFYMHSTVMHRFHIAVDSVTYSELPRSRDEVPEVLDANTIAGRLRGMGLAADGGPESAGRSGEAGGSAEDAGTDEDSDSEHSESPGGVADDVEMAD
uniref:Cytochrome P450 monooxygenase AKT7 ) n=1 Tax=Ganoderma boninense TaxID=34458 RepID=A0A5K1K6T8_9APHY|nr:Cytochrome P450 monooxygenase AKT7 (EC (AK-toxin biosynthesis protein 7) [Ganoderma boninense]